MTTGRKLLFALVTVLVVLGFGYVWGASGRGALQTIADESRQALDLAEARGAILEARVSLYNNNFGDASRRLEESKDALRRLKTRFADADEDEKAASVDSALKQVEEAQQLAGKLDAAAQSAATKAHETLKTVTR